MHFDELGASLGSLRLGENVQDSDSDSEMDIDVAEPVAPPESALSPDDDSSLLAILKPTQLGARFALGQKLLTTGNGEDYAEKTEAAQIYDEAPAEPTFTPISSLVARLDRHHPNTEEPMEVSTSEFTVQNAVSQTLRQRWEVEPPAVAPFQPLAGFQGPFQIVHHHHYYGNSPDHQPGGYNTRNATSSRVGALETAGGRPRANNSNDRRLSQSLLHQPQGQHLHETAELPQPWDPRAHPQDRSPYLLLSYLQILFNSSLAIYAFYLLVEMVRTVRQDISERVEVHTQQLASEQAECRRQWIVNGCENPVPALEARCAEWRQCMELDPRKAGRHAMASAEMVASIANLFIEPLGAKTFLFVAVVGGVFYASNFAFGYVRAKSYYGR